MPGIPPVPGETPLDDVSGLIPRGIRTRAELSSVEAENVRKAVVKYLSRTPSRRLAPYTYAWGLKLHREMFGEVWSWAGQPRRTQTNLGIAPHAIVEEVAKLFDDLRYWRAHQSMEAIERVARLHHRAVFIHPFANGNGRWARMLANIHQKQTTSSLTKWPERAVGATSHVRDEYLRALRAADGGDLGDLIALHRRYSR